MRLIDADALRKAFYKDRVSVCSHVFSLVNPLDSEDLAFEIYNMIDDAPTVDAVPVVRCGECKYFIEPSFECRILIDRDAYGEADARVYPEYFCADGERRGDGEADNL